MADEQEKQDAQPEEKEVVEGEIMEDGPGAGGGDQPKGEMMRIEQDREKLENYNDDILSTLKDDVLAKKNEMDVIQRDFRSKRIAKKMYITRLKEYAGAQEKLFERKVDLVMSSFDVVAKNKLSLLKSCAEHSAKQIVKSSEVDIQKTILEGLNEVNEQFMKAMEQIMKQKEAGMPEEIIQDSVDRAKKLREQTLQRIFEKSA